MTPLVAVLFGPSWKTSLAGLLSGAAVAAVAFAQKTGGLAWYAIAGALVLAGRLLGDSSPGLKGGVLELLLGSAPTSSAVGALTAIGTAVYGFAQTQNGLGWAAVAAGVAAVLRFAKVPGVDRPQLAAVPSDPPKGFILPRVELAVAVLILALMAAAFLVLPSRARGQETQPAAAPTAPLAIQVTPDLSLRLNVSVVAGSYDLTHRAWLGQAPITGLYALTSKRLLDAGVAVGGSLAFDTSSRPSGELNGGLVSPKLVISPALALHGAVLYARRFGPDAANLLRIAPTLEF
jgi:hypothetical protein